MHNESAERLSGHAQGFPREFEGQLRSVSFSLFATEETY